jgi:hypothetical protein
VKERDGGDCCGEVRSASLIQEFTGPVSLWGGTTAISTRKYVSSKEGKSKEISSMTAQRTWIYWKQKDTKE